MPGPLLIGYDGSDGARHAIEAAGGLLGRGRAAVVLHVWRPLEHSPAARFSLPARSGMLDEAIAELDGLAAEAATKLAAEGAELAAEAGFEAAPRAERADRGAVWEAIVAVGQELDSPALVVGTRGLSAPRALILGSVSTGLLHHAQVPVVVVPSHD